MFANTHAFSGFSVNDLDVAKKFYGEALGLAVTVDKMGLTLHIVGGTDIFVYQKDDHKPATFTVLNFEVDDIDEAVAKLKQKGIEFEHYPEMNDDNDIARGKAAGMGPDIAWFTDPAGNVLSVLSS